MLMKWIARAAFYLIALLSVIWTATLTYTFIASALPELDVIAPAFGLIVFDGGMVAWLLVYLHYAEGAAQRGVAIGGTIFDLVGVGLMAIAEIFLGGQTYAAAPEVLGEYALWGIGIWTIVNVALVILFHLVSPEARRQMALRDAQDQVHEEAFRQLKSKVGDMAQDVADQLSDEMVADAKRALTSGGQAALRSRNGATPEGAFAAEAAGPKGARREE